MYSYFFITTDCLTNTWDTAEILRFLRQFDELTEKDQGHFGRQMPFIDLWIMKVKDYDHWSNYDFDPEEANYISIVTAEYGEEHPMIQHLFRELENFLGWHVCQKR